jgi:hypothetical protein
MEPLPEVTVTIQQATPELETPPPSAPEPEAAPPKETPAEEIAEELPEEEVAEEINPQLAEIQTAQTEMLEILRQLIPLIPAVEPEEEDSTILIPVAEEPAEVQADIGGTAPVPVASPNANPFLNLVKRIFLG